MRVEHHHEPESTTCPMEGCGQPMQRVGQDVSERLDILPAQFFVHRHIRGKWACRCCQILVQEPVEPQIIDSGMPAARCRPGGAHAGQPLRRSPAELPARGHQRTAAARTRCALKAKFESMNIRKGHKKSVIALAHKMLRIIFAMLNTGQHAGGVFHVKWLWRPGECSARPPGGL